MSCTNDSMASVNRVFINDQLTASLSSSLWVWAQPGACCQLWDSHCVSVTGCPVGMLGTRRDRRVSHDRWRTCGDSSLVTCYRGGRRHPRSLIYCNLSMGNIRSTGGGTSTWLTCTESAAQARGLFDILYLTQRNPRQLPHFALNPVTVRQT